MTTVHLDCAFGLAGDMFLAALADLWAAAPGPWPNLADLETMFRQAGLVSRLAALPEKRGGVMGRRLEIVQDGAQPLRVLPDILGVLEALPLSPAVRERSTAAFTRLAEAEAKVHGTTIEHVHFHEVGGVDTLVDVVGAFWALSAMGVTRVTSTPLPWFTGFVHCAHGRLPLPAPATTVLLQGKPVYATEFVGEMITPTGALIIDQLVEEYVSGPTGVVAGMGLGYGTRDTGGGVRVVMCA